MAIKTVEKGCYLKVSVCNTCDWFYKPLSVSGFISPPRVICPDCGDDIETVIGRYVFNVKREWLGLSEERCITGFERKCLCLVL